MDAHFAVSLQSQTLRCISAPSTAGSDQQWQEVVGVALTYHRVSRLFETLALARGDGRHARMLKAIARVEVLILDDWGLAVLTATERRDLLEILEDRHGRGSTIVTSQLPVDHWHEAIGDPTLADAILDRLVHNAHRLTLSGDSLRRPGSLMKTLHQTAPA